MFVIRPVSDKNLQKEICSACQCSYLPDDFAYFAADLSDDGTKLLGILGICQFSIQKDSGVLHKLQPFPGTFDEEVMIIMTRTAMEFVHRCGCVSMVWENGAYDIEFAKKTGFRPDQDGVYRIDLEEFYKSPCHFQAALNKKNEEQ